MNQTPRRDKRQFRCWLRKKSIATFLVLLAVVSPSLAAFPDRPIKIIVYTEPGGPIDLTARKWAHVAAKYSSATLVVENMPGAGGLIAMEHVLDARADGHTLLACTKSNIAKAIVAGYSNYLNSFDWRALLLIDPECIITRRDQFVRWQDLVKDARKRPGGQIWVGPGIGSMDHIMATRVWDAFGISGRWVPFGGGGKALATLMGGQADTYVGNPGDAIGRPELCVCAIASENRLPQLPDTPTFTELGHPELSRQFMWRGFALRSGCSEIVRNWYDALFQQVTLDDEWRSFWEENGMQVVHYDASQFQQLVQEDQFEFNQHLSRLNLIPKHHGPALRTAMHIGTLAAAFLVVAFVGMYLAWKKRPLLIEDRLIPWAVVSIGVLLSIQTIAFPAEWQGVGAATGPRLWIALTAACGLILGISPRAALPLTDARSTREMNPNGTSRVGIFLLVILLQWLFLDTIGYSLGIATGTMALLYLLGERRWYFVSLVGFGWPLVVYFVFARLLNVDLPIGGWFESIWN